MKILVLIDAWFPFIGGAQVQIKNLKRILEKDYNCQFFILHAPSANIFVRFLWSFWVIPQAIYLNSKHDFDLIHAHAYWPGIPGNFLSKILKIPVIFTIHGSNLLDLGVKSLRGFLEKIILTKVKYDQVISVSSNFLKYKNVNKDNISVIPNGVDVKLFDKVKAKKDRPFKVLFVGRKDPVKGLVYLKQAMVQVRKELPGVQLKVITSKVEYSDLIKEYKSSHVFVLPSLSEGQPLTLLEAWAAKLPVVVTNVGDNPKMVKNGFNGYLVKPKDSLALTKAVIKLLENKKRSLIGEEGYQLVKDKYSWQKCAQQTYKLYRKTSI